MTGYPPSAERVLQQEAHHVVLGEQLRHGRDVGTADLDAGVVDSFFLGRLPELVDPAESILRREHLRRNLEQQSLQCVPVFGREPHLDCRIGEAEHTGQDLGCEASGNSPRVGLAEVRCEIAAVLQRQWDVAVLGMPQESVCFQEACEQQPVPLLIGDVVNEVRQGQTRVRGVIAELASLVAKCKAKLVLLFA